MPRGQGLQKKKKALGEKGLRAQVLRGHPAVAERLPLRQLLPARRHGDRQLAGHGSTLDSRSAAEDARVQFMRSQGVLDAECFGFQTPRTPIPYTLPTLEHYRNALEALKKRH